MHRPLAPLASAAASTSRALLAAAALVALAALVAARPPAPAPAPDPLAGSAVAQRGHAKLAPYTGIRWPSPGTPPPTEVLVEGTWYELVSLAGVPADEIYSFCETTWPGRGQKRFGEDLVEALARMGHTVGTSVDLEVRELGETPVLTLADVPMTRDNRQAVLARNKGRAVPRTPPTFPRIALPPVVDAPDARYAHLARLTPGRAGPRVKVADARADLVELEQAMTLRFSYLTLTGVDRRAAFDALHHGLAGAGDEVPLVAFALGVKQLLALFGDGHTRLTGLRSLARPGYAPYLLQDVEGGVVAYDEARSALLDPKRPFVSHIDGEPLDVWLAFAERYEALGSPQFRRRGALRNLRYLAELRAARGLDAADTVTLTLADAKGRSVERTLELRSDRAPAYGGWPRSESGALDAATYYLRLPSMGGDPELLEGLRDALEAARGKRGLVIDVRDNGGGTRDALRLLFPLLIDADAEPVVVNVAAKRLEPGEPGDFPGGSLDNRRLYPLAWDGWSDAARASLAAVLERFEPDWELPAESFGAWHGFVIEPAPAGDPRRFEGDVVVLMNAGCYSATDIFLGALELLPRVTLVGTASGGGSGRSRSVDLRRTGLEARLSSMASFRPSGARYDGRGVEPDVVVRPAPTDPVGGGDAQLDAARKLLREARR